MKENNGFTLIELLGAVIIIAILALISFPLVVEYIRNSQKILVDSERTVIKLATERFLNDNKNNYPRNNGVGYCISIQDLVDGNYLSGAFVDANNGKLMNDKTAEKFTTSSYVRMNVKTDLKYTYCDILSTIDACQTASCP